tara:strand:+ start:112 stop:870 length:759 start_codon:yes stop_codon:yes gene_type:complete
MSIDYIGYRAKIGVLVPFTNTIVQPELESLRPKGVTNHTARIPNRKRPTHSDEAYAEAMKEGAIGTEDVIDRILPLDPDLIILGHSIDSFAGGVKGAKSFEKKLCEYASSCPVVIPSLAMNAALESLQIGLNSKISIITPYLPSGGEQARNFFEDSGFKVENLINLSCKTALDIASVNDIQIKKSIKEVNSSEIKAIVQVGTNLPFQYYAPVAEKELSKPVMSINTASYWYSLRSIGINDKFDGFGELFKRN